MSRGFMFLGFVLLLFSSCKSEYEKAIKRELATGVINNELIFGLEMGQTQKEFYEICWDLNKEKKITHGPKNLFVKYEIKSEEIPSDSAKIEMLFYGIFDEEERIMRGLDNVFYYSAWSIWNEKYHSGPLLNSVKEYYMNLYGGNEFMSIDLNLGDVKSYVKIDGNRRIVMYPKDTREVIVKIEDTRYLNLKRSI